jgi:hypothetical protein
VTCTGGKSLAEGDYRQFHDWRATTAGLLQDRRKETNVEGHLNDLVNTLAEKLRRYSGAPSESFEKDLRDIVERAVDLDAEFAKQRAHYYVGTWIVAFYDKQYRQWVDRECHYKTETMENVEGDVEIKPRCRISLVIRPVLFKAGNAFGKYYGVQKPLVKALVTTEHYLQGMTDTTKPFQLDAKKEQKTPRHSNAVSSKKAGKQRADYDYPGMQAAKAYNPTPPLESEKEVKEVREEKTGVFKRFRRKNPTGD